MGNKTLYAELKDIRQKIRTQEKQRTGNVCNVCSEQFLSTLAKIAPRNLGELSNIAQVTEEFSRNYGREFVQGIVNYTMKNSLNIKKSGSNLVGTLKELEKKLVNLNRRNRLLYSNKLANKHSIDMLSLLDKDSIYDLIFSKEIKNVKLCDLSVADAKINRKNESNYNKLVQLLREANREFREKGQYDLYIAYPFVRGRMQGEDFEINAPLVLFPVKLIKEPTYFNLKIDASRDVVYNNNLLLANYKFNKINKPLPSNVIYELSKDAFHADILAYYGAERVEITPPESFDIDEYFAPTESNVVYRRGDLNIVNTMVLGKFSTYSSSMQRDLNSIIDSGTVNSLLEDLLSGMEDYDFYSEDNGIDDNYDLNQSAKEADLCYINPINSTQENVILASDNCKELVVQGPPGTGKSQVITSLIANAVTKNKTVLMVSEKKSALDVVYSRLGNLSKYVLLLDDVNNKDIFYNQIDSMCKVEITHSSDVDIDELDIDIDECMNSMNAIAKKLRDKETFGLEVYKLYHLTSKWDLSDTVKAQEYNTINRIVSSSMKRSKYQEVKKAYLTFKKSDLVDSLTDYMSDSNKYPQLFNFKPDISQADLASMINDCEQIISAQKLLEKLKLSNKRCVKRALAKLAKNWFSFAYNKSADYDKLDLVSNTHNYTVMSGKYNSFIKNKQEFDELSEHAADYFTSVYRVAEELSMSINHANEMVYKFTINNFLISFETDNRVVLNKINDYGSVLDKLSDLLDNKIALTKENLSVLFENNIQNLTSSKRYGEIRRLIESKKRLSVAKFSDKFFVELFTSIKVWLLTPEVVSEILPLKPELFDMVIFDEASQMYIEKGIPAILRAKSVIIAGDSKQLRPSNLGSGRIDFNTDDDDMESFSAEDSGIAALEEESLLDVARFKYPPMMLDFHYRSKYAELIAFSNYAFYGGKLNVSPNPFPPASPPIKVVKVKGAIWEKRSNRAEAEAVVDNIKSFFRNRKNNETIGVITFNSSQRDLILDIIDEVSKTDTRFAKKIAAEFVRTENGEDVGIFVKNIENVQGDERDHIIFSIGYAENEDGKVVKNFGWLSQRGGENRLNVAISRAKNQIVIVSSIDPSDLDVENCKNEGPAILKKYLAYAAAVSSNDKKTAKAILLSFIPNESANNVATTARLDVVSKIKDGLISNGFDIEENVGVGSYTIDMGVMYDGKFILGIEFDSSLYASPANNRERDFHRWKYFKLRGWKMHRVWSNTWWDSPESELQKILNRLNKIKNGNVDSNEN